MTAPDHPAGDKAARELSEWAQKFRRVPLTQRYIAKARFGRRCTSPEDVLGDRMALLSDYLWQEHTSPGEMHLPTKTSRAGQLLNFALAAFAAPPYLWPGDIMNAVAGMPLPRHVVSPTILPEPRSWHTFVPDLGMWSEPPPDWLPSRDYVIPGCSIKDAGDEFVVTFLMRSYDEAGNVRLAVDAKRIRYGSTYPDDFDRDRAPGAGKLDVELVLSMLAFLNSPYIPKATAKPNRDTRRRLGLGKAEATPDVTFVILRRPATRKEAKAEAPEAVEWKHRWIVSGHYRAQWYPSEQAHHVIWIAPYVKGPEDAPMLEHVYKVAR